MIACATDTVSFAPRRRVTLTLIYDAFISYCHADDEIASALQSSLQRFSRPWYRRRPFLRVLRDDTSFGASSDLADTIREALDSCKHLVVLLSPESAQSPWVAKEVEYWLDSKGVDTMTMVVTEWDGDEPGTPPDMDDLAGFRWDGEDVPEPLRGALDEPLAVDLRWVSAAADMTLDNDRFRNDVAEIAAAIKDQNKDELVGEIIAMRTRARILTGSVFLGIGILIAAIVAAGLGWRFANEARDEALQEQMAAETATRLATDKIGEAEAIRGETEQIVEQARSDIIDFAGAETVTDACGGRYEPSFDPEACIDAYEDYILSSLTLRKLLGDAVVAIGDAYDGIESALE